MQRLKYFIIFVFVYIIQYSDLSAIDLSSKITIITTCSPCISYPRTIFLQISQYSMYRNFPQFDNLPKIIVCDGVKNPKDESAYSEYKKNLKKLVETHPHFKNTKLIFCDEWVCLVGALKEAFKHVKTEYVFIHQDDFEIALPIDLEGLINAMDKNSYIKHVRLNSGINAVGKSNPCDFYIDDYVEGGSSFPLLRTPGWGDNDHFVRTDYYLDFIFPLLGDEKTFMEHKLMDMSKRAFIENPEEHIKFFGTYLYGKFNEGPYLLHLDRKSNAW